MVRPIAATAAVALFATGGVIGAPVESAAAASSSTVRVVRSDVALAASSSILNIPFNLFQAIVNIPYNEVQALNVLSDGMFLGGPWFVASNTNIWGVDPADPPKFEAAAFLLVPFPALSGLGAGEFDWDAGLGQQLAGLAAAELQVNKDCVVGVCLPFTPRARGRCRPPRAA